MKTTSVCISTSTFGEQDATILERLKKTNFQVEFNPLGRKLKVSESTDFLTKNKCVGLIAGTEELSQEVLKQAPTLKVISRCGGGVDNVDIEYCKSKGILVYNTPDAPIHAVAELALGLILTTLRKIAVADRGLRSGVWKPLMGSLLRKKIVGIIGFGRIGRRLAELLAPFDCTILFYDPNIEESNSLAKKNELKELLAQADIISIHASIEKNGKPLIGQEELRLMKKEAFLVNTTRGSAVDERALLSALKEQRIGGAALDVFAQEPYNGPLAEFENVVLTCHMGSYAKEARILMEHQAIDNLLQGFHVIGVMR